MDKDHPVEENEEWEEAEQLAEVVGGCSGTAAPSGGNPLAGLLPIFYPPHRTVRNNLCT